MKKRLLSLCLALLLAVSLVPITGATVALAETVPAEFAAPTSLMLTEVGSDDTRIDAVYVQSDDFLQFAINMDETEYIYPEDGSPAYYDNAYLTNDYSYYIGTTDYSQPEFFMQTDYRVDGGAWQYDASWETTTRPENMLLGMYIYIGSGSRTEDFGDDFSIVTFGYLGELYKQYYPEIYEAIMARFGNCIKEQTDGANTYYAFDADNHSIEVRIRYAVSVLKKSRTDRNDVSATLLFSDWSETAKYGKGGDQPSYERASDPLSAPTLSNPVNKKSDGDPDNIYFYADLPAETRRMLFPPKNQRGDDFYFDAHYDIEASLDGVNWIEPSDDYEAGFHYTGSGYSPENPRASHYDLDYLSEYLFPEKEGVYYWESSDVYLRARLNIEYSTETAEGKNYYTITSDWSNVIKLFVDGVDTFEMTIENVCEGNSAYDEEYATKSFSRTEGDHIGWIYASPVEGCFVQKVTVDGAVMYNKDDAATHELLDWDSDYEEFAFLGDARYATKDLDIVITYGGTPTEQFDITVTHGQGGTIWPSGQDNIVKVYYANDQIFQIDANTGFVIESVTADDRTVEIAKNLEFYEYTFADVREPHTLHATFKRVAHYIEYGGSVNGEIKVIKPEQKAGESWNGWIPVGGTVQLSFVPKDTYGIEYVSVDYDSTSQTAIDARLSKGITLENVQADHHIYVKFSDDPIVTHEIIATSGKNGYISPSGTVLVEEKTGQTFTFYPDAGYVVDEVTVDGALVNNLVGDYYTFANVTARHTIHVTFKKVPVPHTITTTIHGNALNKLSPSGTITVMDGDDQKILFQPHEGYEVVKVTVDGTVITGYTDSYTFANVTADHTFEVWFEPVGCAVRFLDYDGRVLKSETVAYGSAATPPANPTREGYLFTGWYPTTYNKITTNSDFTAQYRLKPETTYTITATVTNGSELLGYISPSGEIEVAEGEDLTIGFYPVSGGGVKRVVVDGTALTTIGNSYKFPKVKANHSIEVTFKEIPTITDDDPNDPYSWQKADGHWYYRNSKHFATGAQMLYGYQRGTKTGKCLNYYLFDDEGRMQTGFFKTALGWVYYGEKGKNPNTSTLGQMIRGYYVKDPASGYRSAGEIASGKLYYYYFDSRGIMYTGWHNDTLTRGYWMYFGEDGRTPKKSRLGRQARYGIQYCYGNNGNREQYMFYSTGPMFKGTKVVDGVRLSFCTKGVNPATDKLGMLLKSE